MQRKGFTVMPDFAGTAHGYCGSTLSQAKGDLLEWFRLPTLEAMLRAYIIKSRVRSVDQLLLIQPYNPMLFAQGTLPGPSLLLQTMKGELDEQGLREAWKLVEDKDASDQKKRQNWPWTMPLPCRGCSANNGKVEVRKPLKAFVAHKSYDNAWTLIAQGADLLCFKCDYHQRGKPTDRVRSIMCDSCGNVLAVNHFKPESVDAWQNKQHGVKCNR